jgi:hypothetical protein
MQSPVRPSPARSKLPPPVSTLHTPSGQTHHLPSPIAAMDRRTVDSKFQAMMASYTASQPSTTMTSTPKAESAAGPPSNNAHVALPLRQPSLQTSSPSQPSPSTHLSVQSAMGSTSTSTSLDVPSDLSQQLLLLELSNERRRQKVGIACLHA